MFQQDGATSQTTLVVTDLFIGEFGQNFRKPLKCKCLIWNSIFQKTIKLIIEKIERIYYYRLRRTPEFQKKKKLLDVVHRVKLTRIRS